MGVLPLHSVPTAHPLWEWHPGQFWHLGCCEHFFFFFLVEPHDEIMLVQRSTVYHIGLGHSGFHPTNGEKDTWGNVLSMHLLMQGSVGLALSRQATVALSVSPQRVSQHHTH